MRSWITDRKQLVAGGSLGKGLLLTQDRLVFLMFLSIWLRIICQTAYFLTSINLFFFMVRFPPIHIAPCIRLQTCIERSTKSPFLKRSASKAFQRILTTPPPDFADASVIVKLPPNWVKFRCTQMAPAAEMQSSFVASKGSESNS